jgi:hypothetical protein
LNQLLVAPLKISRLIALRRILEHRLCGC